ncbi:MAG: small subunit ribosomal protein S20 [Marinobacter sp. T13-3]|nr:MAG: small subunit ribosomal protein S20 [Marinobacter sp. T13-3]
MANTPQAKKRARQNEVNRKHNASLRSMARTYIKKVEAKINAGNAEEAKAALQEAQPIMDSMVNKGIFAKNKVARTKSRLNPCKAPIRGTKKTGFRAGFFMSADQLITIIAVTQSPDYPGESFPHRKRTPILR